MADWTARLREIYGTEIGRGPRVLHVAAVADMPGGRRPVLRVDADTPSSDTDAFVLEAARARVDAILTTGEILRREPGLRHDLSPAALAWRRDTLGLAAPPLTVVLTRRPDEIQGHPLLRGGADERRHIESRAGSLRQAIERIEAVYAVRSTLIEAGPTTARELYRGPGRVDELLLSVCREPALPESGLLGEFASLEELEELFGAPARAWVDERDGGRWRFERYVRER